MTSVVMNHFATNFESDYEPIDFKNSLEDFKEFQHAAHAMIFARDTERFWNALEKKAQILMHIRFDGYLGFPGGLIDKGESVLVGLQREIQEEIGLDPTCFPFANSDHVSSHINYKTKLALHFFAKEVALEEFKMLESNMMTSKEFGVEVLGPTRVPLYTMEDGYRGLPVFLNNMFIGNSRHQLLNCALKFNLLTKQEIDEALEASNRINNVVNKSS
ncbi:unnamed protein product [Owenia fusiformis]|uniref:U8 snoRNA-decapping enzyme n=1 Tax=Owenia fusiformis TaxID=6347 RepID=A0A8S4NRT0_OWEFU|nr:unnamed protein product [Owenia fusiformis]